MNKLRFEILNLISSNPRANYSIRQISEELKNQGIKAHYALVYKELENLKKEKTIGFLDIGKSKVSRLNFSWETTNKLEQLELEKINYLDSHAKEILSKIEAHYIGRSIESIALINHKKFKGLNYFELLITLNDSPDGNISENEKISDAIKKGTEEKKQELEQRTYEMLKANKSIEKKIGAKINPLILLEKSEFIPKLFSNEENAIREGFLEHYCFYGQKKFWQTIGIGFMQYNTLPKIMPSSLSDEEITYFLGHFGFEISARKKISQPNKSIGIEHLISEILSRKEPRWFEGIPIIISKNLENKEKINFKELLFLARRKNKISQLGYLLETAKETLSSKEKISQIETALQWLELFKSENEEPLIEGVKAHKKQDKIAEKWHIKTNYSFEDFRNRMREYNAE